jgi:hypothetical protein
MSTIGGGILSTLGLLGMVSQTMLIASLHHFKPSVPATAATTAGNSSFFRRLYEVLRFVLTSVFVLVWCFVVGVGVVCLEQQDVIGFLSARKIARYAALVCARARSICLSA